MTWEDAPFWYPAWQALCDKWNEQGYDALSHGEKVWLNIRGVIDAVNDGGLAAYFYNTYADHYEDCLAALTELGAADVRARLEEVHGWFPGVLPPDRVARTEAMGAWDGSAEIFGRLDQIDDELIARNETLEQELEAHIRNKGLAR